MNRPENVNTTRYFPASSFKLCKNEANTQNKGKALFLLQGSEKQKKEGKPGLKYYTMMMDYISDMIDIIKWYFTDLCCLVRWQTFEAAIKGEYYLHQII